MKVNVYIVNVIMNGGKISEVYSRVLNDLRRVRGVKSLALASKDGFLISGNQENDHEILTLMSAAMLSAAEAVTIKFEKVPPDHVTVDYIGGKIIATGAGPKALISVMTEQEANLDPIITELDKTARKVREII